MLAMIFVTLIFFARFVRAQRDFILMKHPYREFLCISLVEYVAGMAAGIFLMQRFNAWVAWAGAVGVLLVMRYVLRKVFQHDVRGVRRRKPQPGEPNQFMRKVIHEGQIGKQTETVKL